MLNQNIPSYVEEKWKIYVKAYDEPISKSVYYLRPTF
jgi:hypothetical protein